MGEAGGSTIALVHMNEKSQSALNRDLTRSYIRLYDFMCLGKIQKQNPLIVNQVVISILVAKHYSTKAIQRKIHIFNG